MKQYLIDKKEEIKNLKVERRKIEFLKTKAVAQAIIGPRRAGKTYSLFYWIKTNALKDEDYIVVNFEDDEIKEKSREELRKIIPTHIEIYGKEPEYIFLDEVQNLERWESFVYSLYESKKYCIFLTGSSSKLLSKEIATQLRGRGLTHIVLPLDFEEYLWVNRFEVQKPLSTHEIAKIKHYLSKFLTSTGFPQIVIDKLPEKRFFKEYLDLVIFKDLVERYGVENIHVLRRLILKSISNFSKELSINKFYNELKSQGIKVGKGVLYTYASYLQDISMAFFLKRFYFSERSSELSIPKVYLCDNGLANYLIKTKFSEDFGRLMENAAFLELIKKIYRGEIDNVFYFKDYQGREVDFVVKDEIRVKQLIQVTYASNKDEIMKREIYSLIRDYELLKHDKPELLVITWDYEGEEEIKGKKIKFIPLWKWLLEMHLVKYSR